MHDDFLKNGMMKKLIYFIGGVIFTISSTALAAPFFTDYNSFADWYRQPVVNMHSRGVIQGYSDGSFGAENNVWVRKVTRPLWCYYEPLDLYENVGVELYTPRLEPMDCD